MFGKAPPWVDQGVAEYAKRFKNLSVERIAGSPVKTRNARMLTACGERSVKVYLDKSGHSLTSETLAKQCVSWERKGRDVCLLIGDDVGFSESDLKHADFVWSLSSLTLPHQLTRVVVCEQLYRARAINTGHAYHRS